ncbi:thiol:disulfide interchange protein TlpA [Lichenihabitans psoromatis]|uniref:thiol:disulfide interchange protein TlpA n=1 Tax=Lichenihabitans psoromatis TaxID=2528642 RepID=UPI001035B666|nr:TlpA disulfide reductase family protein [Lichenihabitans psoromatis]
MTDTSSPAHPSRHQRLAGLLAGGAVVVVCGGLAVLYGMGKLGKEAAPECRTTSAIVSRVDPFVHGEVAALNLSRTARPVPALAFKTADGSAMTLADFKGKTVLLNLWATWCVPCRKEMPALDRLQAKLGSDDFQVVAINIDTAKLDRPKQFLQDTGVTRLPLYTDATATVFQTLRADGQALGLPTTMLIDPHGCGIGTMAGPAEWDSADAEKLIAAAKGS